MRIDPAIVRMRGDAGLQRRARAAMLAGVEAWRAEPEVTALLAGLDAYGAGVPIARCDGLRDLFALPLAALGLATGLCGRLAAELAREPLGQLPFRHGFDGAVSSLLLARSGRAQLVLHAREPGWNGYVSADYSHAERHEVVLGGAARARIVRRGQGGLGFEPLALQPGASLALDLACAALQVIEVERRLVSLRLHRFAESPEPSRSYALDDGALLHQSAGGLSASRGEVALAVLGRMGRSDAVPAMAALARAPGDDSLRWQALRECLALDTAEGFRTLLVLAQRAGDPLAGPAGALRAQLVECHPELLALESEPCPA